MSRSDGELTDFLGECLESLLDDPDGIPTPEVGFQDCLEDTLQRTESSWGKAYIIDYEGFAAHPNPGNPLIEVTSEKVQDAPLRFRGKRVTVLNFASGVSPGGGVRWGSVAQEEELCRCSGLLHSLELMPDFYEYNLMESAPAESYDMMIVSEDVPLIRNGEYALVDPMDINVITYPAPNGHRITDHSIISEVFKRRCVHVVIEAVRLRTEVLILGPWGCGEYANDPVMVARSFKEAIRDYGGGIAQVVFACYGNDHNLETFKEAFK